MIGFYLNLIAAWVLLSLRKEVDKMIEDNKKIKSDTVVFGINGSILNYVNTFYPLLEYFKEKGIKFIPLKHDYSDKPRVACRKMLAQIKPYLHHKKIVFVCHSYGGIVGRYLVRNYLRDKKKFSCITVGSPNHAGRLPHYFITNSIIYYIVSTVQPELKDGILLKYLENHPFKHSKLYTFFGKQDTLVPKKYARVHKAPTFSFDEDHMSIMYSEKVFDKILQIINK